MIKLHTINANCTKLWLAVLWLGHGLADSSEETSLVTPKLRIQSRNLAFVPGSLQSGPDSAANSFASASYVDAVSQTLHIVGTSYGNWWSSTGAAAGGTDHPSCFYAIAQLPTSQTMSMTWIHTQLVGKETAEEGCRDLLLDQTNDRVYLVGYSDPTDALLSDLYDPGSLSADNNLKHLGTILDYKLSSNGDYSSIQGAVKLEGGRVLSASRVNYPVAMTGRQNNDTFYTVSMLSSSTARNILWEEGKQNDPGEFFHYGTNFQMMIQEFIKDPLASDAAATDSIRVSVKSKRSEILGTESEGGVFVAAMLQLPDRLIVTGYTAGFGYGLNATNGQKMDDTNTDGFVTQIGLEDLRLVPGISPYRIASGEADYVAGACYSSAAPNYFYVVGFTDGSFLKDNPDDKPGEHSTRGYIMKLSTNATLAWVQEFEPTLSPGGDSYYVAKAISCAVTADGDAVYVAGTVDSGYVFGDEGPFGETDVWVAQLAVTDGTKAFVKQMGSNGHDTVARQGGLQVDADGNAVLIGNTNGQIYRGRNPTTDKFYTDVFVATFEKNTGSHTPASLESITPAPQTPQPTWRPTPPPAAGPAPPPAAAPPANEEEESYTEEFPVGSVILIVLIALPFACCLYIALYGSRGAPGIKRDATTHRKKVLGYLHNFDVEDIELKHSATGGWHCSYLNDLAKGRNKECDEDLFSLASRVSRSSRRTTSSGNSAPQGEITFSLDNPRSVPSTVVDPARPAVGIEGFSDEIFTVNNNEDDDLLSFGSSRSARRERRNIKAASLYSDSPSGSETKRKARSRASSTNQSSLLGTGSPGSLLGTANESSRAKERWQNREVI